jgi:hypothetical protein
LAGQVSLDLVVMVSETSEMPLPDVRASAGLIFDQLSQAEQEGFISGFRVGLVGFGSTQGSPFLYQVLSKDKSLFVDAFSRLENGVNIGSDGLTSLRDVATNMIRNPIGTSSVEPGYPNNTFPGDLGFCALLVSDNGRLRIFPNPTIPETLGIMNTQRSVFSSVYYGTSTAFVYEDLARNTEGLFKRVQLGDPSDSAYNDIIQNCIQNMKKNAGIPHYDCGSKSSVCGNCPPEGRQSIVSTNARI